MEAPELGDVLSRLARKYDRPGPRYTSYPTAVDFHAGFGEADYRDHLRRANASGGTWSLYVHVPFCRARCHFCACSVIATRKSDRVVEPYLAHLERELELVADELPDRRAVAQLHLGGGTPTYLQPEELERLMAGVSRHFELTPDAEVSLEVDPRVTTRAHLETAAELGFNRISLGVQDLDAKVQDVIGRHQPHEMTASVIEMARELDFASVNVDLVYGLPAQTLEGLERSLDSVVSMRPDRLAIYGYAHVPWVAGNQKVIDESLLLDPEIRLEMLQRTRKRLLGADYRMVGMDHYALPTDTLSIADAEGRLRRNFMGYGVRAGDDMLGFGVTAIGDVAGAYVQNTPKLNRYYEAIDEGRLPVARGLALDADDELRRRVISDLMCRHEVVRAEIESAFDLDAFDETFAAELGALTPLMGDGLLVDEGDRLRVTPTGRALVRNVAMAFDARLRRRQGKRLKVFSRTV